MEFLAGTAWHDCARDVANDADYCHCFGPHYTRTNADANARTKPKHHRNSCVGRTSDPDDNARTRTNARTNQRQPPEIVPTTSGSQQLADAIQLGVTDPITARATITQLLVGAGLSSQDETLARAELNRLGELLLFDPSLVQGDPFATRYVVQPGDSLARIAKQDSINAEWGLIQTINNIPSPDRIRVGQSLKVPVGTFHAVVSKRDHVMDMYLANDEGRIIVASFPVGLGEYDGTPIGRFRVRPSSKVKNPPWRNPRTGEYFQPENPANPIGERWIGLEGTDADNRELLGYGIHGTIDSDSIGANESMGCVRMLDPHVRLVYDMLISSGSTIEIRD